MEITNVGQLREKLRHSDDDEPLIFDLEEEVDGMPKKTRLKCVGIGTSGGGRITVIWLDRKE
jgi:hypothetical protein